MILSKALSSTLVKYLSTSLSQHTRNPTQDFNLLNLV